LERALALSGSRDASDCGHHRRFASLVGRLNLPTVAIFSGDKTLTMLQRYAHANTAHVQGALDKLEARYRKAG
jgi:hypothetical protein